MLEQIIYMPVLRLKTWEKMVLESFDFGSTIYPCVEIFRAHESLTKKCLERTFAENFLPLLGNIKSDKVFVDLPVQLKANKRMKPEVLDFVTKYWVFEKIEQNICSS